MKLKDEHRAAAVVGVLNVEETAAEDQVPLGALGDAARVEVQKQLHVITVVATLKRRGEKQHKQIDDKKGLALVCRGAVLFQRVFRYYHT